MAPDLAVSRELKSLQDELAATQRERSAAVAQPTAPPAPEPPAKPLGPAERPDDTLEQRQPGDQISHLMDELGASLEEAEKAVAAHPVQSMLGALLLGILIGRLLGRR